MHIPDKLTWLKTHETGASWIARLPALVSELAHMWDLQIEAPYDGANVSYVAAAMRGPEPVVLKVQWPHPECAHEAAALTLWDGNGAVRLLAHDAERHALMLERCSPGTSLSDEPGIDPLAVLIDLLPKLWVVTGAPFKPLTAEAQHWAANLHGNWQVAGKPCERTLIDAAVEFIGQLAGSQGEQVLVHQDLHGENCLAAERAPWLVIDPKPLVGEREFSLAPIIRSFEFGHSQREVVDRLDRLCFELRLDRDRACRWAVAQTLAWSFDGNHADRHFETARWLLAAA